jgi:hypothetical protein
MQSDENRLLGTLLQRYENGREWNHTSITSCGNVFGILSWFLRISFRIAKSARSGSNVGAFANACSNSVTRSVSNANAQPYHNT